MKAMQPVNTCPGLVPNLVWGGEKGKCNLLVCLHRGDMKENNFGPLHILITDLLKIQHININGTISSLVCADVRLNILVYTKRRKDMYANRKHETTL